jgi:hypothetical protein
MIRQKPIEILIWLFVATTTTTVDGYSPISRGLGGNIFRLKTDSIDRSEEMKRIEPGMMVRANVGGSQRQDQYFYEEDPTNGGINFGGGTDPMQLTRQDVPPSPPEIMTNGVTRRVENNINYNNGIMPMNGNNNNNNMLMVPEEIIEFKETGSNVGESSVPALFSVPPNPPGKFTKGVVVSQYPGQRYSSPYIPPSTPKPLFRQTGSAVGAPAPYQKRTRLYRRNRFLVNLRNALPSFQLTSKSSSASPNGIDGLSNNYYSPPSASANRNPFDIIKQQQQQQQQPPFFPTPTPTMSNPGQINNVPDSNYYSTTSTNSVYDDRSSNEYFDFQPSFPQSPFPSYAQSYSSFTSYASQLQQQQQQQQQRQMPNSMNSSKMKQLQTQWNKHVANLLGASQLYLQASVTLGKSPNSYGGMASSLLQRSETLRTTGLDMLQRGLQTNGIVEMDVPKPSQQQLKKTNNRSNNNNIVGDTWQQLLATELALSESNGMLVDAASEITGFFDPSIVLWLQSTYDYQIQQTQQIGGITDYVKGIQQQDDVTLRRLDEQFR